MPLASKILSSIFSAAPALLWLFMAITMERREYFWLTYFIVCIAFVAISVLLGFVVPSLLAKAPLHRPWMWILIQGGFAWLAAILILGLLNLTPLCIGKDNGDGNNDLMQCVAQSILVGVVYSPLELIMLTLSALTGGFIISKTQSHQV